MRTIIFYFCLHSLTLLAQDTLYKDCDPNVLRREYPLAGSTAMATVYDEMYFRLPDSLGGDSTYAVMRWRVYLDRKHNIKKIDMINLLTFRSGSDFRYLYLKAYYLASYCMIGKKVYQNEIGLSKERFEKYLYTISQTFSYYPTKRSLFRRPYIQFHSFHEPCKPTFEEYLKMISTDEAIIKFKEEIERKKKEERK